jgi:hypothetical protein
MTCVPCSDILHGTIHTCTSLVPSVFPGLLSTAFQLTAYNYAKNILTFLMNLFNWFYEVNERKIITFLTYEA